MLIRVPTIVLFLSGKGPFSFEKLDYIPRKKQLDLA